MTKPDWRHIDTVTEEMYREGQWIWINNGLHLATPLTRHYGPFLGAAKGLQVYGPIPDPPKPPPKIRRFHAVHRNYGSVSGIRIGRCTRYFYHLPNGDIFDGRCDLALLSDIRWLDEE